MRDCVSGCVCVSLSARYIDHYHDVAVKTSNKHFDDAGNNEERKRRRKLRTTPDAMREGLARRGGCFIGDF